MRPDRREGLSVRVKLMLSYAGFLLLAGALLLTVVWVFLLRYVPDGPIVTSGGFVPSRGDLLDAFVPPTIVALFALLVVGLGGGWLLAGRMLSPLARITDATRIAASGVLSHRIGMEERADEFGELARSFDLMLARIESHVDEQRRFAANASHELRTPLAIMRAVIDVAAKDPARNRADDLARLKSTNDRAIDLTQALLVLSRAGRVLSDSERVDLSLLSDEAVETLIPFAEKYGVRLHVTGVTAEVLGSPALLAQMITNLVHNAIVHNEPSTGQVWVRTEKDGDAVSVTVENTGGAVSAAQIGRFTEPFLKGSGRLRLDGHSGNGLGLSIVEEIVHTHGGTLALTPRPGGGITARVRIADASAAL